MIVISATALSHKLMTQKSDPQQWDLQEDNSNNHALSTIEGFSFGNYIDGELESKIKADLLQVTPIKFFIFKLNRINEIRMSNVSYEYYEISTITATGEPDGGMKDPFKEILPTEGGKNLLPRMGIVKRVVMDRLSLKRYQNKKLVIEMLAKQTIIDLTQHKTTFRGITLIHPRTGKKIYSERAHWDKDNKAFIIPGNYQAISPKGKAKGEGIAVDLNFRISKYDKLAK